jgi:hypothetical protein
VHLHNSLGIRVCGLLIALWLTGAVASYGQNPPTPDAREVVRNVSNAERQLVNIEVQEFDLITQTRPKNTDKWEPYKIMMSGSAWYNGLRYSKVRIHISQRILPWVQGASPWYEERNREIAFDGQFGRVINGRSGPAGRVADIRTAMLLPRWPTDFDSRLTQLAAGVGFSLGFYEPDPASADTLSKYLTDALAHVNTWTIAWDSLYGDRVLRVEVFNDPVAYTAYWFDVDHGYALRRAERRQHHYPGQQVWDMVELTQISKLVEAAPGIWFPIQASRQELDPKQPGNEILYSYHAAKIIANNPSFDESVFAPPFPPKVRVFDMVHGGSFVTANASATAGEMDKAIADIKTSLQNVGGSAPPIVAESDSDAHRGVAGHVDPTFALIAGALICIAISIVVYRHQLRRK